MNKNINLKNSSGSKIELVQRGKVVQANEQVQAIAGLGQFVNVTRYFSEERTIENVAAIYESLGFKKVSA